MASDRYGPCNCGSGRKYKFCHLPIEQRSRKNGAHEYPGIDPSLSAALGDLERKLRALPTPSLMEPGDLGDLAVLHWLLDAPGPAARRARLYAHPRMLVSGVIEALRECAPKSGPGAGALLDCASAERAQAEEDHVSFPLQNGPIARLVTSLSTDEASELQVRRRAASPLVVSTMSPRYIYWLGHAAAKQVKNEPICLWVPRLALVATAGPLVAGGALHVYAAIEFLDVAKAALGAGPKGPLLAEAAEVGGAALLAAREIGDRLLVDRVLFSLATVHLDPYTAGSQVLIEAGKGRLEGFAERVAQWLRSEGRLARGGPSMPPAAVALAIAEGHLRECCEIAGGRRRGFARKALAEALIFQSALGATVVGDEVYLLVDGALEDLDRERDVYDIAMLRQWKTALGGRYPGGRTPVFSGTVGDLERRYGTTLAADLVLAEVRRLEGVDPAGALATVREAGALLRRAGEKDRISGFGLEIGLLSLANGVGQELAAPDASLVELARAVLERANHEDWPARRLSACLIALALSSGELNDEVQGLAVLDLAVHSDPSLAQDHAECLRYFRATLLLGAGVNSFSRGHWSAANDFYSTAIEDALALGLDGMSYELLERVGDIVRNGSSAAGLALAAQIASRASRLEARLGARATDVLQDAYKQALSSLTNGPAPADAALTLFQLAKGRRFASVLSSGVGYRADQDIQGARILDAIARTRSGLGPEHDSTNSVSVGALSEEVLVATYADAAVEDDQVAIEPAQASMAHLANLERRYDAHLSEQLLGGFQAEARLLRLAELQAALGPRTVLVDLFVGRGPANDLAVYSLCVTREAVEFGLVPHGLVDGDGDVAVDLTGGAAWLRVSALARQVAQLRRSLQEPPLGRRQVGAYAAQELERLFVGLLGAVGEHLGTYREAGKDHLCFVPHGPLHYLPLHLLGRADHPLATEWTVTYLPNLHLLAAKDGAGLRPPSRPKQVIALGLGFAEGRRRGRWPPLRGAVLEAQQIAALFGERAVVNREATSAAVLEALKTGRRVHVATHGTYDAFAPAFQSLELSPAGTLGGKLYAHRLLGRDLRGLQLVTLSACHTALGRFDAADNLRGLPASLLLGGVSTVIGTLWPVRDDVARCFFVELYNFIRGGSGRLEAFAAAQAAVRHQHPQHRDWGCFYYAGRWEREDSQHDGAS